MTPLNRRYWMRAQKRHTPAHVVYKWDGKQVVTVCGWEPDPGGEILDWDGVIGLDAYACSLCARVMKNVRAHR